MKDDDIQTINSEVAQLLTAVFGEISAIKLPLDLSRVLDYCGLTLREGTFESDELAGALDRDGKTIFVESADTYARKNFTIAHELGHFKLHKDMATDIFYRYQVNKPEDADDMERELQANQFAATLLMPEQFIRQLWEVTDDINKLAHIFGVSPEAMRRRLQSLRMVAD